MIIGGLQKITLIDFPEKVAATVFTAGCNFRCAYCHNGELVDAQKIKNHSRLSGTDFFNFLKERRGFLEGICVSGGEPTVHSDLVSFIRKIKKMDYAVKLDTNGSNSEMINQLLKRGLIDYIAMDIKCPINKYKIFTKSSADDILKSVELIRGAGVDYEFRTTTVSSILTKDDFIEIGRWLDGADRYFLQKFRSQKTLDKRLINQASFSDKELNEILENIRGYFKLCEIRG